MKKYTGTIYQCEYCGKKSAWKHVITNHEKSCKRNPNNQHKCFQYCKYLIKESEIMESEDCSGDYCLSTFTCEKTGQMMYSYKLERQQEVNAKIIKSLVRMPLNCDHYECSGGDSGDYEFNSLSK